MSGHGGRPQDWGVPVQKGLDGGVEIPVGGLHGPCRSRGSLTLLQGPSLPTQSPGGPHQVLWSSTVSGCTPGRP